ncbi:MAG TPA: hypothetical protein V6C89_18025 [Drouetiella sp.]
MFFIPGFLIAWLTFPGVICHEFAHRLFCDLAKVPVYKVVYFQLSNPSGYVIHGKVPDLKSAFLISVGPFFVNTILCSLISFSAAIPFFLLGDYKSTGAFGMLQIWLAISIGMHAFPSKQDLDNFLQKVVTEKNKFSPLSIASRFMSVSFFLARLASFFWFDAIYAIIVMMFLPCVLLAFV